MLRLPKFKTNLLSSGQLTSDRLVLIEERVTEDVFRTQDGKLIKVLRILGKRGLMNRSQDELEQFLYEVTMGLRQLQCATNWVMKREPLNFTPILEAYEEKMQYSPFELPERAYDEMLDEMNRLTYLQNQFSIERYYVVIIANDWGQMEDATNWFKNHQTEFKNEKLTFNEVKQFLKEWYN